MFIGDILPLVEFSLYDVNYSIISREQTIIHMNKVLQRFTVVGIMAISVPFSLSWANKCHYHNQKVAGTGTFQVISRKEVSNTFSGSYMDILRIIIQAKRDKKKEVVIQITPETTVRILPQQEISKLHFIPVEGFVFVDRTVKRTDQ